MSASSTFHIIGYVFGLAAFSALYLSLRPYLVGIGQTNHLKALLPIHFFRFFGLTALLPGVFDLAPAGFSHSYLTQIMVGDVIAAILALITFGILHVRPKLGIYSAWIFNVIGFLDYLNAGARVTPAIHDANILGPFGWIVMTVMLPAWLVSHIAIFFVLLDRRASGVDSKLG